MLQRLLWKTMKAKTIQGKFLSILPSRIIQTTFQLGCLNVSHGFGFPLNSIVSQSETVCVMCVLSASLAVLNSSVFTVFPQATYALFQLCRRGKSEFRQKEILKGDSYHYLQCTVKSKPRYATLKQNDPILHHSLLYTPQKGTSMNTILIMGVCADQFLMSI